MATKQGISQAFTIHNDKFRALLGSNPQLDLLLENQIYPFAHEAGVFIAATDELFITSNSFKDAAGQLKIQISKIALRNNGQEVNCEEIQCPQINMGNGGVNYKNDGAVLFCAQGDLEHRSGLYAMSTSPPYLAELVIDNFYGRSFNSVNDVVIHSDGSIWFTDPIYGYEQGFRPKPELPNQVYRYNATERNIRVMADGFGRPNGICFSPDEKVVYITDTDWIHGDGTKDGMRPSTIYAFDVTIYSESPFLTNRRMFAMADTGIPDGIKCDMDGNVYSGCGDGVNVWSPGGVLLGRILIEGGAANFCFGKRGEMFILNEYKLWRARLAGTVKGALLRI